MKAEQFRLEILDKKTNKLMVQDWPVSGPRSVLLSNNQLKRIDKVIKTHVNDIKKHFNDGAWTLKGGFITDAVLYDIFGCHIEDYLMARIARVCKVEASLSNEGYKLTNKNKKVFYTPKGNRIYLAEAAKNVEIDIQLGDF